MGGGRLLLPTVRQPSPAASPRASSPPTSTRGCSTSSPSALAALPGPEGEAIGTRVFRPRELWREQRGIPPDLIVYFGDLGWRSNGSLGHGRHWTYDNDTGPDDANHDRNGLCIVAGPGVPAQRREDLVIYDIAPTILAQAGLAPDEHMRGRVLATAQSPI